MIKRQTNRVRRLITDAMPIRAISKTKKAISNRADALVVNLPDRTIAIRHNSRTRSKTPKAKLSHHKIKANKIVVNSRQHNTTKVSNAVSRARLVSNASSNSVKANSSVTTSKYNSRKRQLKQLRRLRFKSRLKRITMRALLLLSLPLKARRLKSANALKTMP